MGVMPWHLRQGLKQPLNKLSLALPAPQLFFSVFFSLFLSYCLFHSSVASLSAAAVTHESYESFCSSLSRWILPRILCKLDPSFSFTTLPFSHHLKAACISSCVLSCPLFLSPPALPVSRFTSPSFPPKSNLMSFFFFFLTHTPPEPYPHVSVPSSSSSSFLTLLWLSGPFG